MEFIYKGIDPIALVVFLFCVLLVTEGLKTIFSKIIWFCKLLEIGFFKVCISWLAGAIMFFVLHLALHSFPVTEKTIVQFGLWTLILNGGYWIIPKMLDFIQSFRSK
jgi:hypothetical protein